MRVFGSRLAWAALALTIVLSACAAPPRAPAHSPAEVVQPRQGTKSGTIGVVGAPRAMGVLGSGSGFGGWQSTADIHSNGLVTTEFGSRTHTGRLAEAVPTVDDGSISLLPDGRMRVVYRLRRGVTWQDGAPFNAHDLVFTLRFLTDRGIPNQLDEAVGFMDSAEAPDDYTFVLYYKRPYYLGGNLPLRRFWPQPRHVLEEPYQRYLASADVDEVVNLRYWTSEYVHLGPFRLTEFDPGEGKTYQAYDGYFLGRPKIDVVRIRPFPDDQVLFSNLLAGSVDIFGDYTMNSELAFQLRDRWESSGEGVIYARSGTTRFLAPQWRPWVQTQPANLDPTVHAALYHAIDREALAERHEAAWSLVPPGDRVYEATRDSLRQFRFDPDRARALLRDAGWAPGPDGVLRHASDGRRFQNSVWVTAGPEAWEAPVYADFWRRVGLDVEEYVIPAAQSRNLELRASYPNWEASTGGDGDSVLNRLRGPAASAENRWAGERGGYEDPRAGTLLERYFASISLSQELDAMRAINAFIVTELPILVTYYTTEHMGARTGLKALEDVAGVGSFSRYGSWLDLPRRRRVVLRRHQSGALRRRAGGDRGRRGSLPG